jgi:hypothetical protein
MQTDRFEIRPGQANQLKIMSRVAPGFIVFIYRSREAVKLGCCKILLDKIPSFGYSMVDESIRRPTGT